MNRVVKIAPTSPHPVFPPQLPPSAKAPLSRARRRRLMCTWKSRLSKAATTVRGAPADEHQRQDPHAPPRPFDPSPSMIDVDDFSCTEYDSRRRRSDHDVLVVGMEEKIRQEECGHESRERKREHMEATRKAICEALFLWGSKAELLKVQT